jgi:hypothetical protein
MKAQTSDRVGYKIVTIPIVGLKTKLSILCGYNPVSRVAQQLLKWGETNCQSGLKPVSRVGTYQL